MAKKNEKKEIENNESYEKLRDELFKYRVDIKSYRRSMSTLIAAVSAIVAIFGFFGYSRIEDLLNKVEMTANARLAKTDSLLASIDTHYLDSLTAVVEERTAQYEEAIAALERGTKVNNDVVKRIISSLPYNKRAQIRYETYVRKDATNYYELLFYTDLYSAASTGECYVVMGAEYDRQKDDYFLIEVLPIDTNVAIYYQTFEIQDTYNKMYFRFARYEDKREYRLNVILIRKKGAEYEGYTVSAPISME